MELICILLAQCGLTHADAKLRHNAADLYARRPRPWMARYLAARLGGLTLRLAVIASVPIGAAATLSSASAIGASPVVGHRAGEPFSRRELAAIALIGLAIALRSFA